VPMSLQFDGDDLPVPGKSRYHFLPVEVNGQKCPVKQNQGITFSVNFVIHA
jgi:hypothetical protein